MLAPVGCAGAIHLPVPLLVVFPDKSGVMGSSNVLACSPGTTVAGTHVPSLEGLPQNPEVSLLFFFLAV